MLRWKVEENGAHRSGGHFLNRTGASAGLEKSVNLLGASKKEEVTILWVCRNREIREPPSLYLA